MSESMVKVQTPQCIVCNKVTLIEITQREFDRLGESGHIQNLFPDWTKEQRELFITGTHPECWDSIFADDEDPDDDGN